MQVSIFDTHAAAINVNLVHGIYTAALAANSGSELASILCRAAASGSWACSGTKKDLA